MTQTFAIVLRGYDRPQVDQALAQADEALASESEFSRAAARDALLGTKFEKRLRGYAPIEVDRAVKKRLKQLDGDSGLATDFTVQLRGYDRFQIDAALAQADEALKSGDEAQRAIARETLTKRDFTAVLRGYDTEEVDESIEERLRLLG